MKELKESESIQAGGEGTDENELKADLLAARETIANFQSERAASENTIKDLETSLQSSKTQVEDFKLKLRNSEDNYTSLKEISDAEESELKRLLSEVSEGRQRIADLEDENHAFTIKNQELERQIDTNGEHEDLKLALQNSKDEIDALHEKMKMKIQLTKAENYSFIQQRRHWLIFRKCMMHRKKLFTN